MNKIKIISYLILLALLLTLGFLRDFIFININLCLSALLNKSKYELPASLYLLQNLNYIQLYLLKWVLTILVSLLYLLIYLYAIWLLFKQEKYLLWTVAAFSCFYILSSCFYFYGWLFQDPERGYHFARIFIGFVQSPFLLMLLIPGFMLKEVPTK